jgi:hypothetical protein
VIRATSALRSASRLQGPPRVGTEGAKFRQVRLPTAPWRAMLRQRKAPPSAPPFGAGSGAEFSPTHSQPGEGRRLSGAHTYRHSDGTTTKSHCAGKQKHCARRGRFIYRKTTETPAGSADRVSQWSRKCGAGLALFHLAPVKPADHRLDTQPIDGTLSRQRVTLTRLCVSVTAHCPLDAKAGVKPACGTDDLPGKPAPIGAIDCHAANMPRGG